MRIASWQVVPVASVITGGVADDSKNFYAQIISNKVLIRASATNATDLGIFFCGLVRV